MSSKQWKTNSLEEFLIVLREYEINTSSKFVCVKSDKAFTEAKFTPTKNQKIHWNDDIPHYYIGRRVYACHQGKDTSLYQKKRYAEKRDSKACKDHDFTQRRNLTQPTKKLGCPVVIYVSRVLVLPSFKVTKLTKYEKAIMSEVIKERIEEGKEIAGENVYSFKLPDETSHQNHVVGLTAAVTEMMGPNVRSMGSNVRSKIKELVSEGKHSISLITTLLEQYIINELGETDKLRSRFYLRRGYIINIVNAMKREIRWSKIDLENAEQLVKSWKDMSGSLSGIYFRPCTLQQNPSEICTQQEESDDECEEENQTLRWKQTPSNYLLFVYQSKQMKYLYQRYGKDGVLLDATYKRCKLALPLYFLAVKTNVGYQPVALIITQYETQQAIFEALNIIKQWNPEVTPNFGMVDFAMDEILALESIFPGIEVFICIFHREQEWTRWSSKLKRSYRVPRAEALKKLRAIANAPTEKKLQEAVEKMKKWNHYEDSRLKFYFERTWLPEIKRWTLAYKPPGLLFHTINGVERINEELKYDYLMENKSCSLSEMMNVMVTHFLPDRYKSYVGQNILMMSTHEKHAENIPKFLHNRPKWIVDFVMEKLDFLGAEDTNQLIVNKLTETSYEVSSLVSENVSYEVNCNDTATCTCEAFVGNRFLCKHMILISKKFPEFNVDTLILKNEVFRIDENVVNLQTESTSNSPYESMDEDVSTDLPFCPSEQQEYVRHATGESKKIKLIGECKSTIRSLESAMWLLEEKYVEKLRNELQHLYEGVTLHFTADRDTALPITTSDSSNTKAKTQYRYAELPKPARKKVKRFGHAADAKENEVNLLNASMNEDDDKNTYFDITSASNISDYHEITIAVETLRNFPHQG